MVRFLKFALITLSLHVLAACAPVPVEVHTTTQSLLIPDNLLLPCQIKPPPDQVRYLSSNWRTKEDMLTKDINTRIADQQACNVQLGQGRDWKAKNQAAVDKANTEDTSNHAN